MESTDNPDRQPISLEQLGKLVSSEVAEGATGREFVEASWEFGISSNRREHPVDFSYKFIDYFAKIEKKYKSPHEAMEKARFDCVSILEAAVKPSFVRSYKPASNKSVMIVVTRMRA